MSFEGVAVRTRTPQTSHDGSEFMHVETIAQQKPDRAQSARAIEIFHGRSEITFCARHQLDIAPGSGRIIRELVPELTVRVQDRTSNEGSVRHTAAFNRATDQAVLVLSTVSIVAPPELRRWRSSA
jgi:hypothetical protein